ncbi:uncharacterized protein V6R79_023354 [Siganus canaliculatus]
MAQLALRFNWTWVGAVIANNDYGHLAIKVFQEEIEGKGVCLEFIETVHRGTIDSDARRAAATIQAATSRVILIFSWYTEVKLVLLELLKRNVTDRQFLASEAWSTSDDLLQDLAISRVARGVLGVAIRSSIIPGFEHFLRRLHPSRYTDDEFLQEFWETEFGCTPETKQPPATPLWSHSLPNSAFHSDISPSFPAKVSTQRASLPPCSGTESLEGIQHPFTDTSQLRVANNVYLAVYAAAHALHSLLSCPNRDSPPGNNSSTCLSPRHIKPIELMEHLNKVNVTTPQGEMFSFQGADIPAKYDLVNWQKTSDGSLTLVLIGRVDGFDLHLNESLIQWSTGSSQVFQEEIEGKGVCLEFIETVHRETIDSDARRAAATIQAATSRVILIFCWYTDVKQVLLELLKRNVTDRQFLGSEAWSTSDDLLQDLAISRVARGVLGVAIRSSTIPGFEHFLRRLHPSRYTDDEFLQEFWETEFGCTPETKQPPATPLWSHSLPNSGLHSDISPSFPAKVSPQRASLPPCSGTESLEGIQHPFTDTSQLRVANNVYLAVYAAAHALHSLLSCPNRDSPPGNNSSTCLSPKHVKPIELLEHLNKVNVTTPQGEMFSFRGSLHCDRCPSEFWSNAEQTACVRRQLDFLSFNETLGITLTTAAVSGATVTTAVFVVFLYFRKTPMLLSALGTQIGLTVFQAGVCSRWSGLSGKSLFKDGDVIIGGLFELHYVSSGVEQSFAELPDDPPCTGLDAESLKHAYALAFAVQEINHDSSLLPGVKLGYRIVDSCSRYGWALQGALLLVGGETHRCSVAAPDPQSAADEQSEESADQTVHLLIGPAASTTSIMLSRILRPLSVPVVFQEEVQGKGLCLEFIQTVHKDTVISDARRAADKIQASAARVILIFCWYTIVKEIFSELMKKNVTDRQFLASEVWSTSDDLLKDQAISKVASGVLGVAIQSSTIPKFGHFLRNLDPVHHPHDEFLQEFWQTTFGCSASYFSPLLKAHVDQASNVSVVFPAKVSPQRASLPPCSGTESLEGIQHPFTDTSQLRVANNVYLAVYAAAHALHSLLSCPNRDSPPGNNSSTCLSPKHIKSIELMEHLNKVNITTPQGEMFSFQGADIPAKYDLVNWQKTSDGSLTLVLIGRVDGFDLHLNESLIQWSTGSSQVFQEEIEGKGVCLEFIETVHRETIDSDARRAAATIQAATSRVILIFCWYTEVKKVFLELVKMNVTDRQFLASEAWSTSDDLLQDLAIFRVARGVLGVAVRSSTIPGFEHFLRHLHPSRYTDDEFLQEFWETEFGCTPETKQPPATPLWSHSLPNSGLHSNISPSFPAKVSPQRASLPPCSGTESLEGIQHPFTDTSQLRVANNVYLAVYAAAHALHSLLSCPNRDKPPGNNSSTCLSPKHIKPIELLEHLNKVNVTTPQGEMFSFQGADIPAKYDLVNWQKTSDGSLTLVLIGRVDSVLVGKAVVQGRMCSWWGTLSGRTLAQDGDVIIGGLFNVHYIPSAVENSFTKLPHYQPCTGLDIEALKHSYAMAFAVEEINRDNNLLPGVKLGYRILDSCSRYPWALQGALSLVGGETHSCKQTVPLLIGPDSSTATIMLSRILGPLSVPAISYLASCPCLSDRAKFPNFFRTIPSDVYQARAMAQLALRFNWTWVGAVIVNNDYGQLAIQVFQEEIEGKGVCLEFIETVHRQTIDSDARRAAATIQAATSRVILIFCWYTDVKQVLLELLKRNVTDRQFLASEAWSTSDDLLQDLAISRVARGVLGVAIRSSIIPGFEHFLRHISPSFPAKVSPQSASLPPCSGTESLEGIQHPFTDTSQLRVANNVYLAVYAAAHALHSLLSCPNRDKPPGNNSSTCLSPKHIKPIELLEHLNKVNVTTPQGEMFSFQGADIPAKYDLVNWQKTSDGSLTLVLIGRVDGFDLHLNESLIQWSTGSSQFSFLLSSFYSPSGSLHCDRCPSEFWSNAEQTACVRRQLDFLSFNETLGITLTTAAVSGATVTTAVFVVFLYFRKTPMVSYTASCPCLSDRRQYPTFFRTMASDIYQARAIAQLAIHFNWTWIGAVVANNDYGRMAIKVFQEEAEGKGVCLAFVETLQRENIVNDARRAAAAIQASTARVILVFTWYTDVRELFLQLAEKNVTDRQFLASEAWSTSFNLLQNPVTSKVASGVFGVAIRSSPIPGFEHYLTHLHPSQRPDDDFLKEFWENEFRCSLWVTPLSSNASSPQSTANWPKASLPPCSGTESLVGVQHPFTDTSQLRVTYNVYLAVYAAAHALHSLLSCPDIRRPPANKRSECLSPKHIKPTELLPHLNNINFTTPQGELLYFQGADIPAKYDLVNWQKTSDGSLTLVLIGRVDGFDLHLNESLIQWSTGSSQTSCTNVLVILDPQSVLLFSSIPAPCEPCGQISGTEGGAAAIAHDFTQQPHYNPCTGLEHTPLQYMYAMVFAVEEINNDTTLLPGVSLGYHILDSCGRHPWALQAALSLVGGEGVSCNNHPVPVIIGGASSITSQILSRVLGPLSVPIISYLSSCPCLSDRHQFPNFFRTIPSDIFQARAIAQLAVHFNWTWIGAVVADNNYGHTAVKVFQEETQGKGVCLAFVETLQRENIVNDASRAAAAIQASTVRVILVFTWYTDVRELFLQLAEKNVTDRQFLASEAWSTSGNLLQNPVTSRVASGVLGVAVQSSPIPGFEHFLRNLHPHNRPHDDFLKEYWEAHFRCSPNITLLSSRFSSSLNSATPPQKFLHLLNISMSSAKSRSFHEMSLPPCSGRESLQKEQNLFTDTSQLRLTYNVYIAVYAAAHALHSLLSCSNVHNTSAKNSSKCLSPRHIKPTELLLHLENVNFTTPQGESLHFQGADIPAKYDLVNWQKTSDGSLTLVLIGRVDGFDLHLNESLIQWSTGSSQVLFTVIVVHLSSGPMLNKQPVSVVSWTFFPSMKLWALL